MTSVTGADQGVGPEPARRVWATSVAIGAAFVAVAMTFSLGFGWLTHGPAWFVPLDNWQTVDGGRFVWAGALGYVYQGTISYALPLSFIVIAPVSGMIDHFGLTEGRPFPIPHPTAWLLVGPYTLSFGILLLHAVRRLAHQVGVRRYLWAVQLAAVALALVPAFEWGHFEDILALTAVVYALRRSLMGDHVRAALYLSVAISSKQWAVMLLPLLVGLAPAGRRLRALAAAVALPGAFTLYVLGVDWTDASRALFAPVNMVTGYQGHGAVFATWLGKDTSAVSRALGAVLAGAVGWRWRRMADPPAILAAAGFVFLLRPLFEAISYSYYWSPAFLVLGLATLAAARRFRPADWLVLLVAIAWTVPRGNPATAGWWWAGFVILLAATLRQPAQVLLGRSFRLAKLIRLGVKAPAVEPIFHSMTTAAALGESQWTQ